MKKALLFPGQGAQYPGMGKDFVEGYQAAKRTLEEADDILGYKLSEVILQGPEKLLTETQNSQTGIFVISIAILRVIQDLFPELKPDMCAGLSLGEYTAATAAGHLAFQDCLPLVQYRGRYMGEACEMTKGTMKVVLGLNAEEVENIVNAVNMPNDLWAANFNCPGQVVISGTSKGIEAGTRLAMEKGARRVLPLQVHGAFHSGLMQSAKERLEEPLRQVSFSKPFADLVMNVTGTIVQDPKEIRRYLLEQVTSPVRWEKGIRQMEEKGVELYIEVGPGKSLEGFNKRIGVQAPSVGIEKVHDLKNLEKHFNLKDVVEHEKRSARF